MLVYFAAMHARSGSTVCLQNYRSMPHVFVMFEQHPSTRTCYAEMSKFVKDVVDGKKISTKMEIVNGRGVIEEKTADLVTYPLELSKSMVDL